MESTTSNALILLAIGMITVFAVLLLVVFAGKVLIYLVNRYGKESVPDVPASRPIVDRSRHRSREITPVTIAVLSAAVEHATGGRGHVASIQKINQ